MFQNYLLCVLLKLWLSMQRVIFFCVPTEYVEDKMFHKVIVEEVVLSLSTHTS